MDPLKQRLVGGQVRTKKRWQDGRWKQEVTDENERWGQNVMWWHKTDTGDDSMWEDDMKLAEGDKMWPTCYIPHSPKSPAQFCHQKRSPGENRKFFSPNTQCFCSSDLANVVNIIDPSHCLPYCRSWAIFLRKKLCQFSFWQPILHFLMGWSWIQIVFLLTILNFKKL